MHCIHYDGDKTDESIWERRLSQNRAEQVTSLCKQPHKLIHFSTTPTIPFNHHHADSADDGDELKTSSLSKL